jgi:hypothetical protein
LPVPEKSFVFFKNRAQNDFCTSVLIEAHYPRGAVGSFYSTEPRQAGRKGEARSLRHDLHFSNLQQEFCWVDSLAAAAATFGWKKIKALQIRVARFFWYKIPKQEKIYQITTNYTKCTRNITKDHKMDQVSIKYTNIFHCKTLPNLDFWFENKPSGNPASVDGKSNTAFLASRFLT